METLDRPASTTLDESGPLAEVAVHPHARLALEDGVRAAVPSPGE